MGVSGRPAGWWRRKSTPAKVEAYTRWSFHLFGLVEVAAFGLPAFGQVGAGYGGWLTALVVAHAALATVTASRALDWTRGRREQPVRLLWTLGVVTFAFAVGALVLKKYGPESDGAETAVGMVFAGVLASGAGSMALGVRNRRRVLALVAGFAFGAGAVSFPLGMPGLAALANGIVALVGAGFYAFTSVFSVWLLNAVYELDEARETRARLAVAEERLRFGRDLHDVLGRNLSVISLKSELAVQLAQRGRAEAVEQMIEVQRIAQESQREVRDVVRGYREADLEVELAGAQGVLTAAGIDCTVSGSAGGLPADVQSALGWVVREATTNVLRHGDAGRCAVGLRVWEGSVVLTVENDGVAGPGGSGGVAGPGESGGVVRPGESGGAVRPGESGGAVRPGESGGVVRSGGSGGSGLAGLRERLAAVDGTLEAGPVGADGFKLVAEIPLPVASGVAS
ncbi:histidine kinase [Streptomyces sp. Li-HN-5-11]|nr:histidine kinase [Streptomyces sp. Li-HN-5-11]WNM36225.1 histidine kinase [Streptomyces sp. Li-HN-5-11]